MADSPRKKRWLPIVLAVSLALNLAVVAAVSGAAWRHKADEKGSPRARGSEPIYMQALSRETRKQMRQAFRSTGVARRPDPSTMLALLRQEPFDATAAADILDAERDAGLMRMEKASAAWLTHIAQMSVAERSAYADRLQALAEKRKARWKERKRQGD